MITVAISERAPELLAVHGAQLVLWLHILPACVWIGGQITLGMLVSVLRSDRALMTAAARRFQSLAWLAFAVLIVTGIVNVHDAGIAWSDLFSTAAGRTLAIKLGFVVVSGVAAALHALVVGPRVASAPQLRRWSGILGGLSLLTAMLAALYGVILAE